MPEADKFHDWIVEEVLPTVREMGVFDPLAKALTVCEDAAARGADRTGFVYVITSPLLSAVKIGCTQDRDSLRRRYQTVYGDDLLLRCFAFRDCYATEAEVHRRLKEYRFGKTELFAKRQWGHYCSVVRKLKEKESSNSSNESNEML